jgi:hypothetical protein
MNMQTGVNIINSNPANGGELVSSKFYYKNLLPGDVFGFKTPIGYNSIIKEIAADAQIFLQIEASNNKVYAEAVDTFLLTSPAFGYSQIFSFGKELNIPFAGGEYFFIRNLDDSEAARIVVYTQLIKIEVL